MTGERPATPSPLAAAAARYRSAFVTVAVLSAVLNVLLLGGSIYMMLIYDSVLPSRSLPTLFGLLAMIVAVYLFQALFDGMRGAILSNLGAAFDRDLSGRVQRAMGHAALRGPRGAGGLTAMRDLDHVRAFLGGPGPGALIDLPWILFFLAFLFLLHPWLGITALLGALVLAGLTWATDRATREPTRSLAEVAARRDAAAERNLRHVELLVALGMTARMQDRWRGVNEAFLAANRSLARPVATFGGISRVFRLFLQSAILTVGALLVIDEQASGGVIFASSILAGRALAPVDGAIANWRGFAAARTGWRRLNALLASASEEGGRAVELPAPSGRLDVRGLAAGPPGGDRATVADVSFTLEAGQALGVVGPSATGKTSLARALLGLWTPIRGEVRLDGATLDQWEPDELGRHLGYLPQSVELLDGTVGENIARFEPGAPSEAIVAAARAAGVHDLVVRLPQGYDTPVGVDGALLSAGQRQRIGLARALYGDPFLVLLDEPNSNLDAPGEAALEQAIASVRARGGVAVVVAHRPSALAQATHVLFLRDGRQQAFGERDEVLRRISAHPSAGDPRASKPPLRGVG